jgi:hypothetical protein
MTEQEWLVWDHPHSMLSSLLGKVSERKLRLFAAACCRRIWHLLIDRRSRVYIEVSERYADNKATSNELLVAHAASEVHQQAVYNSLEGFAASAAHYVSADLGEYLRHRTEPRGSNWTIEPQPEIVAVNAAEAAAYTKAENNQYATFDADLRTEYAGQTALLRCIIGNPFRPVTLSPAWQTANVIALAQAIYDERAFDRMPILGDALEEAGCDNADILNHCRQPGEHVRGCWVIDLLLGKE